MKIIAKTGNPDLATIYVAKTNDDKYLEFVESVQPPLTIDKKWVLIISTLFGCPVSCAFCDCGYYYKGKLSTGELFEQIDLMVSQRFPDKKIPVEKFKIQFARMGEPTLNHNVLEVLKTFQDYYDAPGFLPSLSTVAPASAEDFFEELIIIKKNKYRKNFQLQFSIHSTNNEQRDKIIPVNKWSFTRIADYAEDFFDIGGKKISLNFVLAKDYEININTLKQYFDPEIFLIKVTPVNPTYKAKENNIESIISPHKENYPVVEELRNNGYETILSIGEWEENQIGSNCGQYLLNHLKSENKLTEGYSYPIENILP